MQTDGQRRVLFAFRAFTLREREHHLKKKILLKATGEIAQCIDAADTFETVCDAATDYLNLQAEDVLAFRQQLLAETEDCWKRLQESGFTLDAAI